MDQGNTCLKYGAQGLFSVQVSGWTRLCEVELPNSIEALVHHITEL